MNSNGKLSRAFGIWYSPLSLFPGALTVSCPNQILAEVHHRAFCKSRENVSNDNRLTFGHNSAFVDIWQMKSIAPLKPSFKTTFPSKLDFEE